MGTLLRREYSRSAGSQSRYTPLFRIQARYTLLARSQTRNTLCLPGVKPGIRCACLQSNPVYFVPAWIQTRNTLYLPGVKPGILCACLESNPVHSVAVWSQTRNTLFLPGVKPGIPCACLELNPEYSVLASSQTRYTLFLSGVKPGILCPCLESNPEYSVPALSEALITRLRNTWSSHYTNWATGSLTVYLNLSRKNFSTIFHCPRKEMKATVLTESGCQQTQPVLSVSLWAVRCAGNEHANMLCVLHLFPLLCISGFHGLLGWIIS
jgi:hypothetical protein